MDSLSKETKTWKSQRNTGKASVRLVKEMIVVVTLLYPPEGFECGKDDPSIKHILDKRVLTMKAQGDNCKGWDSYQ